MVTMELDMSLNLEIHNKMTNETLSQLPVEQRLEQLIVELFEQGATEEQIEQLLIAEQEDLNESADSWNSERTKAEWRRIGTFDDADFKDKATLKAKVERHLNLYNKQFASKDWKHSPMNHNEMKRMYKLYLKEDVLDEKEQLLPTKQEVSGFTKSAIKHDKEKIQHDEVVEYIKSLLKRKKQVQESVDQPTADKKFKKGDLVTTIYGEQARVHSVLHPMVTVIDAKGKWQDYHHTKVWLKKNK